jgi:hypothetical protein
MKRAIIVHCWSGYPEYCWYPYVKKELETKGFQVVVPAFPETDAPQQDKWVPFLAGVVAFPDENTYLIGHSIGCATILRYLESLKIGQKISGAVLVAGFDEDLGFEELKNYFIVPIDFAKIKTHCLKFVSIHSDNDPFVDIKFADVLQNKLSAKEIIKHNMGHFSGAVDEEASCVELPDVVEAIEEMSKWLKP